MLGAKGIMIRLKIYLKMALPIAGLLAFLFLIGRFKYWLWSINHPGAPWWGFFTS